MRTLFHTAARVLEETCSLREDLEMRSLEAEALLASSQLASVRRQSRKENFDGGQVKVFPIKSDQ